MAYTTVTAVKRVLRKGDIERDSDIQDVVEAASEAVDNFCGTTFSAPVTETRQYLAPDVLTQPLLIDDIATIASISVTGNDQTWTVGSELHAQRNVRGKGVVRMLTLNADRSWATVVDDSGYVSVTGDYGWSAVPSPVREAAKLWAARLFLREDNADAVLGFATFDDAAYIRTIDPDISKLLLPYAGHTVG